MSIIEVCQRILQVRNNRRHNYFTLGDKEGGNHFRYDGGQKGSGVGTEEEQEDERLVPENSRSVLGHIWTIRLVQPERTLASCYWHAYIRPAN